MQRALSARSDREARLGIIVAGFFKLLIPFMSIGAGIAAFYYFRDRNIDVDQDAAFMELMRYVVAPVGFGIVGLVAAGVVGAILSSVDSMLNSGATIITFDVYKRYVNPTADERSLVLMGRIWVVVFIVAAAALTIFTMNPNSKSSFFLQIASHQSKLVAGVVVAFALGMFWRRATAAGATTAIIAGVVCSYGLPIVYSGHMDDFKIARGYIGAAKIQQVDGPALIFHGPLADAADTPPAATRHFYQTGDVVRFAPGGEPPVAQPPIESDRAYFVHAPHEADDRLAAWRLTLHRTPTAAETGDDPIEFLTGGDAAQLYLAATTKTVSWWGTRLNFMHSVFLAAMISSLLHVVVSLLTAPPGEQRSRLTWTELGGHQPAALRKTGWKLLASLGLFGVLAWLVAPPQQSLSPLVAGVIAGGWTFLMFLDVAIVAVIRSQVEAAKPEPAPSDAAADAPTPADASRRVESLLEEDRFWAGLLCGLAVFMLYYFF